jgi:non-specific serine/threonine protein kinase
LNLGLAHLRLGDERRTTERALTVYLLALVEESESTHTEDGDWMARFDAELDNLRLALDAAAAAATDSDLELRLAGGLWRFWWSRGYLDEGLARLERALGRANEPSLGHATALRGAAAIAWSRGDLELAETRATETLALAREIGSRTDELAAHTILGILANQQKDFARARRHHEESLDIQESLGHEPAVEKLNLGIVSLDSGDNAAAVALFEDVLGIHRRNDNRSGIAFATLNLGLAHLRLGDAARAQESFLEARAAFAEVGFRAHVAHAIQGLAACAGASGSHDEAARLLGRAAAELGGTVYSEEEFPRLAADVEARARQAVGNEAFEAAYSDAQTRPGPASGGLEAL